MKPHVPTKSSEEGGQPVHLEFDDNRLLLPLFGEFDQNLARIEQRLGVSLTSRGNQVAISGPASGTDVARTALMALYERLRRGMTVDVGEVDAAIRLAASAEAVSVGGGEGSSGLDGANEMIIKTPKRHITPRSAAQREYIRALGEFELVFGLGPAGTGKTYLAVAMAVSMLMSGKVDRIILSRPAVEAGEKLGFLPGDVRDKVDPYLRPLYDALYDMLPADQVVRYLSRGEIEVAPLAFMRGRTLAHAYVILDEAQNTTPVQMKMLLTRLGENARMAVTGDLSQVDLPPSTASGLKQAAEILGNVDEMAVVRFTDVDVVRHALVTKIVRAYDREERQQGRARAAEPASE